MHQRYYSNVYWHFTGSPANLDGRLITRPADIHRYGQLKPLDEAIAILLRILETRRLLATSVENLSDTLQTDPFCCVTDIPLKDLAVHAVNYGRVAIGYKASAIHRQFVPVLYLPKDNLAIRRTLIPQMNGEETPPEGYRLARSNSHRPPLSQAHPFLNYIKITDFGQEPGSTFYSEREWRCVGDYEFETEDVEAVIAPAEKLPVLREQLFDELRYPNTLSLFSWEFLEGA